MSQPSNRKSYQPTAGYGENSQTKATPLPCRRSEVGVWWRDIEILFQIQRNKGLAYDITTNDMRGASPLRIAPLSVRGIEVKQDFGWLP